MGRGNKRDNKKGRERAGLHKTEATANDIHLEQAREAFNRWDLEYVEPRRRVVTFLLPEDATDSSSNDEQQGPKRVYLPKKPSKRELRKQRKAAAKVAKQEAASVVPEGAEAGEGDNDRDVHMGD